MNGNEAPGASAPSQPEAPSPRTPVPKPRTRFLKNLDESAKNEAPPPPPAVVDAAQQIPSSSSSASLYPCIAADLVPMAPPTIPPKPIFKQHKELQLNIDTSSTPPALSTDATLYPFKEAGIEFIGKSDMLDVNINESPKKPPRESPEPPPKAPRQIPPPRPPPPGWKSVEHLSTTNRPAPPKPPPVPKTEPVVRGAAYPPDAFVRPADFVQSTPCILDSGASGSLTGFSGAGAQYFNQQPTQSSTSTVTFEAISPPATLEVTATVIPSAPLEEETTESPPELLPRQQSRPSPPIPVRSPLGETPPLPKPTAYDEEDIMKPKKKSPALYEVMDYVYENQKLIDDDGGYENLQNIENETMEEVEKSYHFVVNPIYMSLHELRRAASASKESGISSSSTSPFVSPNPENHLVMQPSCSSVVSATEDSYITGSIDLADEDIEPPGVLTLDSKLPPPRLSNSSTTPVQNAYTPTPRRGDFSSNSFSDSLVSGSTSAIDFFSLNLDETCDDVIQPASSTDELSSQEEGCVGLNVAYFGYVLLQLKKKEKERKRVHARLQKMQLSFHEDDLSEQDDYIAGPFKLTNCQMISREDGCIFIRLGETESTKIISFIPEERVDDWMLLLGQCWLTQYLVLCGSVKDVDTCGIVWLRQGSTSEWMQTAAVIHHRTLFYVFIEDPNYIYELDIRKILGLREKVGKSEWCTKVKRKDQKGPFMITLENCCISIESANDSCTSRWLAMIERVLSLPCTSIEDYRLSSDNVPMVVEKCIRFVSTYGMEAEGIYRRNGKISEGKTIMKSLMDDPVGAHIVNSTNETVYAVADVVRQFFRRLDTPLFPLEMHKDLFVIVLSRGDPAGSCAKMRDILHQLPTVSYQTLRKLMDHLSEVTRKSMINKATVENLARVFGPSLFHTDTDKQEACFRDNQSEIGVVIRLINDFDKIFEITTREEINRSLIVEAKTKMEKKNAVRADGLLVSIHMFNKENCPFNVNCNLAAEEVCIQAKSRRGFSGSLDAPYALFEMIRGGALSRRMSPSEKLDSLVINRWITWKCTDAYLLFSDDRTPSIDGDLFHSSGKIKMAEPGSKTFHTYELKLEDGCKVCSFKGDKLIKSWDIKDTVWYTGAENGRKPPTSLTLTFFHVPTTNFSDKRIGYCVAFDVEKDRTKFLNGVLYCQTSGMPEPLVHL